MKNTHELEDDLRERWLKSYPDDERKAFCFDGLCYNGEIYNDGKNAHQGNEEKLWNNTDRRILFLMKDTNNNSDSDYREWHWRNINHNFFNCIFKWLEGLSRISKDFIPTMENGDYAAVPNAVVTKYPLAIVNIKKNFRNFIRLKQNIVRICKQGQGFLTGADTWHPSPQYHSMWRRKRYGSEYSQKHNI